MKKALLLLAVITLTLALFATNNQSTTEKAAQKPHTKAINNPEIVQQMYPQLYLSSETDISKMVQYSANVVYEKVYYTIYKYGEE